MSRQLTTIFMLWLFVWAPWTGQAFAQQKLTDTVYYDMSWKICESPIASYYRVGSLYKNGDTWMYSGPVKDYLTENDSSFLLMKGNYDSKGLRQGPFTFYYINGNLFATGNYEANKMAGDWRWYYKDGKEKAEVSIPADAPQDFSFKTFIDQNGDTILKNGTGKFEWNTNIFYSKSGYSVSGFFENGKRSGKWQFEPDPSSSYNGFKEIYNKEGNLKRARYDDGTAVTPREPNDFQFSPENLDIVESFAVNDFFKINGEIQEGQDLYNYLVYHKPVQIKTPSSNFDSAMSFIELALNANSNLFDIKTKDIDAKISFRLGPDGYPQDITITGTGLTHMERNFITFLLGKFSHIDMPGTKTISIEGYHDIYVFDIDISPYFSPHGKGVVQKQLFFSQTPKNVTENIFSQTWKGLKKELRKNR